MCYIFIITQHKMFSAFHIWTPYVSSYIFSFQKHENFLIIFCFPFLALLSCSTMLKRNSTVCVCVLVTQLCPTLWDPMDCSPPGSSFHGIFQTRKLEWVVISFSRGSSRLRDRAQFSCIAEVKVTQSCPTLCDPMDYTVQNTLQARILEWVA